MPTTGRQRSQMHCVFDRTKQRFRSSIAKRLTKDTNITLRIANMRIFSVENVVFGDWNAFLLISRIVAYPM